MSPKFLRTTAILGSAALIIASLASCGGDSADEADVAKAPEVTSGSNSAATSETSAAKKSSVWNYADPSTWGTLPDSAACSDGTEQSPIDIVGAEPDPADEIAFAYKPLDVDLTDNTHTIDAKIPAGDSMTIDGTEYQLAGLHYHSPSEHTIDGKSYPAEFHFVHKTADSQLSVVGVMLTSGSHNDAWEPYIANMPNADSPTTATLDFEKMLPADKVFYRYAGSLTTPPCSEGVLWNVMKTPVEVSPEQLEKLTSRYSGNNRPVQDLDGRKITESAKS